MTLENEIKLIETVNQLQSDVKALSQAVASLKINNQSLLHKNESIPAGISCKVAYDSNGLIIHGESLKPTDIPEIPMTKITGLSNALKDKVTSASIQRIENKIDHLNDTDDVSVGTGVKINYNRSGHIVSTSQLDQSDIPDLFMDKIIGLSDIIEFLKSQHSSASDITNPDDTKISINQGVYTKLTVDASGHVTHGSNLSMDDLPNELLTRINQLESILPTMVSSTSFNALTTRVNNNVESNAPITPGTYTKIKVDQKGLITQGSQLSINDLPRISIQDINNLESTLRTKVDRSELVQVNESMDSVMKTVSQFKSSMNDLNNKCTEVYDKLRSEFTSIKEDLINRFNSINVPSMDGLLDHVNEISNTISTLHDRIESVEFKIRN